jgi:hypothetical protein
MTMTMISSVDAFLAGWLACRERGTVAYAQNPKMSPYMIFAEMTLPERTEVLETLGLMPPQNAPLGEFSIG